MNKKQPVPCGCGGEARIGKIYCDAWTVECTECGIQSGCYDTEVEAIEAWNRAMGERREKVNNIHEEYDLEGIFYFTYGNCNCCGMRVQLGDNFCHGCGARLEWE